MKADKYGAFTEQKRHRMGWVRRAEGYPTGPCSNCRHMDQLLRAPDRGKVTTTYRCKKGEFATTGSGGCNEYVPR